MLLGDLREALNRIPKEYDNWAVEMVVPTGAGKGNVDEVQLLNENEALILRDLRVVLV